MKCAHPNESEVKTFIIEVMQIQCKISVSYTIHFTKLQRPRKNYNFPLGHMARKHAYAQKNRFRAD